MSNKKQIEFKDLSPKDKRIALAEDVIKHLTAGKIRSCKGSYVNNWRIQARLNQLELNGEIELQNLLLDDSYGTCEVCAKGALFISDIMRNNNYKISSYDKVAVEYNISNRLSEIFTRGQLDLIETSFEMRVIKDNDDVLQTVKILEDRDKVYIETPLAEKAIEFGDHYINRPDDRLIAIMQNIIDNDCEFIP